MRDRVYKVVVNGTEFTIKDRSTAVSFAETAKTYMNCKDNYSWSGRVTIEVVDLDDESDPVEDDDEEEEEE